MIDWWRRCFQDGTINRKVIQREGSQLVQGQGDINNTRKGNDNDLSLPSHHNPKYKNIVNCSSKAYLFLQEISSLLNTLKKIQIEIRNGQVFLVDAKSTNGTQLNRYIPLHKYQNKFYDFLEKKFHINFLSELFFDKINLLS